MPFLRNCWYVAAWSDEVPDEGTFNRRILNDDILFARGNDGMLRAMRNRCPHRFAPLSLGERVDDVIECAYHGLKFNLNGQCVLNPHGGGQIPPNARVQTYPVVERHMLAWIWMGEPAKADPSTIPNLVGLDPGRFAINRGYMHTPANYEYMTDNIMDLGHIEFLHKGLLGSEAVRHAEVDVAREGNVVHSNRLTRNEILPMALEVLYETSGEPVDRWLDVTWYPPGNMQLVVGVTAAGEPERIGRETPGVHLMTPETDESTHYFWSNARDFRLDDEALHAALDEGFQIAFEQQDKPMIMAQHGAIGGEDFWDLHPVILEGDAGAVRARRILRKLIKDEQVAG
ncbi:aromatic ring-hydroxylating dioxygenase subunit alpha [Sphingosinicella microcystinivorans]|uniref:(2Fe-2S)-binding protein n=1 Tax=Sphingosinicella microcystinivorans TaxID=335406 RepID=A0AAD1D5I6_SPHMI|nr:aromatic ring-hydroxylating dioxygenase subunit alpha [Sphingosinicella microcystinivorans]RKS91207.1 vanillate O-demethylase monooxygenase subunit [Sphingosinicella microcystinivorans]BBE34175.1 (2Fe-2S)-binding protein [Sphingosinicella microcystinivorans]